MPAAGGARTRLIAGTAAVACAAIMALVPALMAPALAPLGALGVLLVGGAAWRWAGLLGPGIAALGVGTLLVLPDAPVHAWIAPAAAGLLLTAELAAWAREARPAVADEARVRWARARRLAILVGCAAAVAPPVLAAAAVAPPGDLARLGVGVGAGTALLAFLTWLARHLR